VLKFKKETAVQKGKTALRVWTWRMLYGDYGRWMTMDGSLRGLRERLVSSATA
jgi:hypothetical protein